MAYAVTKVQAYGIEAEEALNKRYVQHLILTCTALAANVDWDLGDNVTGSLGAFWTDADGTATGLTALAAIQDIETRAESFLALGGKFTLQYSRGAATAATVYTVTANTAVKTPNIAFDAAAGPTATTVVLSWILAPGQAPVEVYASV